MGVVKRETSATRVSRDVEARDVADLALAPLRAALAASIDGTIHLQPVTVTLADRSDPGSSTRLVELPEGTPDLAGRDVILVVDDAQWFRLRALTIRGNAVPAGNGCYRVEPRRVVAWDYGALREIPAAEALSPRQPISRWAPSAEPARLAIRSAAMAATLRVSRVMVLATRSAKGTAFAVPLWFVFHRGRIYATTAASSWTVRNVDACPQVALLLGGERGSSVGRLLVRGRAQAVLGRPPAIVLARIALRYYLAPRFAAAELRHIGLWGRRMRYYARGAGSLSGDRPRVTCAAR